jgi:hypothetical protein
MSTTTTATVTAMAAVRGTREASKFTNATAAISSTG